MKVAVVIGASSGVGLAVRQQLACVFASHVAWHRIRRPAPPPPGSPTPLSELLHQ